MRYIISSVIIQFGMKHYYYYYVIRLSHNNWNNNSYLVSTKALYKASLCIILYIASSYNYGYYVTYIRLWDEYFKFSLSLSLTLFLSVFFCFIFHFIYLSNNKKKKFYTLLKFIICEFFGTHSWNNCVKFSPFIKKN